MLAHASSEEEEGDPELPEEMDEGDDELEEDVRRPEMFDAFCMDMVDLIARNQCGVTGMANVLRVVSKHIKQHMTPESQNAMPFTVHLLTAQAREITGVGAGCRSFYRHFCIKCGEIFPLDLTVLFCVVDGCPGIRFDRTGKPKQKALYYDLKDKLQRLLTDGFMREFLMAELPPILTGPASRRLLSDVFDGDILNNLRQLWPLQHVIYVAMVLH